MAYYTRHCASVCLVYGGGGLNIRLFCAARRGARSESETAPAPSPKLITNSRLGGGGKRVGILINTRRLDTGSFLFWILPGKMGLNWDRRGELDLWFCF
jgi:hypothetical protein